MEYRCSRAQAGHTYQQRAVVVELAHQNASILEEVSGVKVDVEVAYSWTEPLHQLGRDIELPRVGRLLDLQPKP